MKYRVEREHIGDRRYLPGDEREARPEEVAHLVARGVLVQVKAVKAPRNKAEARPRNKARS